MLRIESSHVACFNGLSQVPTEQKYSRLPITRIVFGFPWRFELSGVDCTLINMQLIRIHVPHIFKDSMYNSLFISDVLYLTVCTKDYCFNEACGTLLVDYREIFVSVTVLSCSQSNITTETRVFMLLVSLKCDTVLFLCLFAGIHSAL